MTLYSQFRVSCGIGTGGMYPAIPSLISEGRGIDLPKKILFRNSLPLLTRSNIGTTHKPTDLLTSRSISLQL